MKDFYEKEHKMIKIWTGIFTITILFFFWAKSNVPLFPAIVITVIFFWIVFGICAIVFGEYYDPNEPH